MLLPEDPWNSWWIKATAYGLFATFGGVMGHLLRTIDGRQKIKWSHTALKGGAAGFVGLLMLLVCQAMHLSEEWTGVIVGVSGWLGADVTILMLESVILKKLGIEKQQTEPVRERADDHPPSN